MATASTKGRPDVTMIFVSLIRPSFPMRAETLTRPPKDTTPGAG